MDNPNQNQPSKVAANAVRCDALVPRDVLNTVAAEWCVDIFQSLTWHQACQYEPLLGAWQTGAEIRAYSPTRSAHSQMLGEIAMSISDDVPKEICLTRIQSRLQTVWDEACPDGMQPDMQIDDLIDAIEGELHRRHVILSNIQMRDRDESAPSNKTNL